MGDMFWKEVQAGMTMINHDNKTGYDLKGSQQKFFNTLLVANCSNTYYAWVTSSLEGITILIIPVVPPSEPTSFTLELMLMPC